MIELYQLAHFRRVANAGGYNAAGRRTGVPAPTLKLAVEALERELGTRLFERIGRGVRITPAGRLLLRTHERVEGEIETCRRELGSDRPSFPEPIRFAAQESYVLHFLPGRIRGFLRRHPEATFDIRHHRAEEVARMVAEAEVEFGLANDPAKGLTSVIAHARFRLKPILIVPKGRRVGAIPPTLESIAALPLILPNRQSEGRRRLDAAFRERGLQPRIVMETGGYSLIRKYVEVGLGASVISDIAIAAEDRLRFRCYDLTKLLGTRSGYLLLRRRRALSPGALLFLKELDPDFRPAM